MPVAYSLKNCASLICSISLSFIYLLWGILLRFLTILY